MTNNDKKKKSRKSSSENSDIQEHTDLDSYLIGSRSSGRNPDLSRTLADVKHELQTMLETMGPETPQFQNTSSEPENDTSLYTISTSSNQDVKKKTSESDSPETRETCTVQESSVSLTSQTRNTSVLVEFTSSQSQRNDDIDDILIPDHIGHTAPNTNISYSGYPQSPNHYAAPLPTAHQNPYNREPFIQQGVSPYGMNTGSYYHTANELVKKKKTILEWFGLKSHHNANSDLYKVRIKQESSDVLPKQLTFERADQVPRLHFAPFGVKKIPEHQTHQFRQERYADFHPLHKGADVPSHNTPMPFYQKCCNAAGRPCVNYESYCPENCNPEKGDCHHLNTMPTYSDASCPCEDNAEPYASLNHQNLHQNSKHYEHDYAAYHLSNAAQTPCFSVPPYGKHPPTQTNLPSPEKYPEKLNPTNNFGQNYSHPVVSKDEHSVKVTEKNRRGEKHKNDSKQMASHSTCSPSGVQERQCNNCGNMNTVFDSVKNSRVFGRESSSFVRSPGNNYEVMHYGDRDFDQQRIAYYDTSGTTRVDVYYFDHGNAGFYRTTDLSPPVVSEAIAEKTEAYTSKFWAEIFGTVHIGFSFFTSFILQFIRFIMYGFLRPLLVGGMQLVSDYFLKPSLSTCFNSVIQPILIFFYNIASSLRDLCDPIATGIGYYIREIAVFVRAFRIVDVHQWKKGVSEPCVNCSQPVTVVGDLKRKSSR